MGEGPFEPRQGSKVSAAAARVKGTSAREHANSGGTTNNVLFALSLTAQGVFLPESRRVKDAAPYETHP